MTPPPSPPPSPSLPDIIATQAIRQRLAQHGRGLDRADSVLLTDCYHDDATVDCGAADEPIRQFATRVTDAQTGRPLTMHSTCQTWIMRDGDRAISESYVIASTQSPNDDGAMIQRLTFGRYLDRHERRDGDWRIAHRRYALDIDMNWPGALHPSNLGPLSAHVPAGGHGASDPGQALLALAWARNKQDETGGLGMSTDAPHPQAIDAIISRQQIADLTMAYCRGIDRADEALLKSIFHQDSVVVSGPFNGNGQLFATEICGIVRAVFDQTFHSIANQWIEVTGDTAVGETYVIAVSTMTDPEQGQSEMLSGGRYLDRFTRLDGVWKFAERSFVSDWSRIDKTSLLNGGGDASSDLRGKQGPDDPVYAMWN